MTITFVAVDRLRRAMRLARMQDFLPTLDEALVAERRATVERIRAAAFDLTKPASTEPRRWAPSEIRLRAILDEEAQR